VSEFWIEKCDNPKCGAEQRVQSMVPTAVDPTWFYFMLEKGGNALCFCGRCAAPIRVLLESLLPPPAAPPTPEIPTPQGPIQ